MEIFDEIKRTFFRKRDDWKLAVDGQLPCPARCNNETKTVTLRFIPPEEDFLKSVLIHELCHSLHGCKTGTHGKVWQGQMLKKSKIAKKKGMANLVLLLIEDVERYRDAISMGVGTHTDVYGRVEDVVRDCPNISYDDLVEGVALEYGATREDFEKGFKRLRKVFERAKELFG
jgi:hypothetical protein